MPSKTKLKNTAIAAKSAALPKIPNELIDQFVTGPMTGEAALTASPVIGPVTKSASTLIDRGASSPGSAWHHCDSDAGPVGSIPALRSLTASARRREAAPDQVA